MQKKTILKNAEKALEQLEKGRVERAKATLEKIIAGLDAAAKAPKRKPGKYALYVKAEYPKMAKQYPNLDAPGIMKKIAQQYKSKK
jgi:hypothetical protein